MTGYEDPAVVIVGAGPAGLTAAAALAGKVGGEVLVLDREAQAGGIPRHSDHLGYGLRDQRRFLTGPSYARRLTDRALAAGAHLETQAMVTGWAGDRRLEVTSPRGRRLVSAGAIVLATGARERPRAARLIAGDRPDGVLTTGQLQNLVHLHGSPVGTRAVVVGGEAVGWSAVLTLRRAGCAVVGMVTDHPRMPTYAALAWPGRLLLRTPILTHSRIVRVVGADRVRAVEIEDARDRSRRFVDCDTVVFTGEWIPDHELVRTGGLVLDRQTLGPVVDSGLQCSVGGVFAVGNLVHPVDTADCAAQDGLHVAAAVTSWLGDSQAPTGADLIEVRATTALRWVTPQRVRPSGGNPRGHLLAWVEGFRRWPVVTAWQGGQIIGRVRTPWPAAEGRVFRIPERLVAAARVDRGPVRLGLSETGST